MGVVSLVLDRLVDVFAYPVAVEVPAANGEPSTVLAVDGPSCHFCSRPAPGGCQLGNIFECGFQVGVRRHHDPNVVFAASGHDGKVQGELNVNALFLGSFRGPCGRVAQRPGDELDQWVSLPLGMLSPRGPVGPGLLASVGLTAVDANLMKMAVIRAVGGEVPGQGYRVELAHVPVFPALMVEPAGLHVGVLIVVEDNDSVAQGPPPERIIPASAGWARTTGRSG